jgi:predicted transcriptional regulator
MTRTLRFVLFLGCLILFLAPFVTAVDPQIDSSNATMEKDTTSSSTGNGQGTTTTCTNCPSDLGKTTLSVGKDGSLIASTNDNNIVVDLGIDFRVKAFAWDPTDSYAIIVGEKGIIVTLSMDGQVTTISSGTKEELWLVSWKPMAIGSDDSMVMTTTQGTYALIVGQNGTVLKWDGARIIHIMDDPSITLDSLDWSEGGDYALIKSTEGKVFRYPPETNIAPFIVISEPVEMAVLSTSVSIRGVAMDPDGTIIDVQVRLDDGKWHTADGTNRWSYRIDLVNVPNGIHTVYARAYDGIIYSSPINIQVDVENNLAPTVTVLFPKNDQTVANSIRIVGIASDPEDQLNSVLVRIDDGVYFKAEGTQTWGFDINFYSPGIHLITVKAFDGIQYSDPVYTTVVVGEQSNDPYVMIISPIEGRTYTTTEGIELRAIADEFTGSELTYSWESNLDGQLGTDDTITKGLSVGHHRLTVTVTDGTLEVSDDVTIDVIDTTDSLPTVKFVTPKESSVVKGQTTITGGADDDQRVMAIKVRVDSGSWETLPGSKVWNYQWDTSTVQDGKHVVYAMAFDGRYWSKPVPLKLFVDNGKAPGASTPPAPKAPERLVQGPTTGNIDGKTTTVIALASTIFTMALIIGLVESFKIKFLSLFFVPLYSRIKKDEVLDNFTRGAIFGFIVANPGAHYNLIKQELMLNNGAIIYHLDILERKGYISSEKAGIFKKYYPKGFKKEGGILETLTDLQRRIFHEIEASPGVSQKEIANRMNITARALNYHIKTLLKGQLIMLERVGRRTLCFINEAIAGPSGDPEGASGT